MSLKENKTKYVSIKMEDKPKVKHKKAKITRMLSITEKYQMKLMKDGLICSNDLLKAVSKNDVEMCKEILENSDSLSSSSDEYYFHPFLLAAKKGRHEILLVFLDHGIDINIQDKKGFNALHYAIQQRNFKCCDLLIDKNINLDTKDKGGNLALHIAAFEGLLKIVQRLLNLNQCPNAQNKKYQTPLHLACIKGHDKIANFLLDKGGRWDLKDINSWFPLHCAAFHGHYECCDILVSKSGDNTEDHINSKSKDNSTPLILAAKKGHNRSCQSLKNSDVNAFDNKGNTALHLAASVSFLNTVKVLLEMKPDVTIRNRDGNTPIHKAAMQKEASCLKLLIEYSNIDPGLNNIKQTVTHLAAVSNSEECLNFLLSSPTFKTKINEQDEEGKTALHLSLNNNHSEVSEFLIASGIDINIRDEKENFPLHIAAGGGMFSICKLLLSGQGVQRVNDKNVMGTTPLHLAAMNGSVDCCKLLITKGADLNAIDSHGFSPFHIAANEGNLEAFKFFTKKAGAYMNQVVEISGETPLHIAAKRGFHDCCEFILRNMKKDFIMKLNDKEHSALDEAYFSENDEIFYLILSKIPFPTGSEYNEKFNFEKYYPFESSLHSYLHRALATDKYIIQKAIVDSSWWYSGFSSRFCESGHCSNMVNLSQKNPTLTEKVYQKCVEDGSSFTKYNFQIFEDFYYVPLSADASDVYLKRESSFNPETGKLLDAAIPYTKPNQHPLLVAVDLERMNLMQHPLSKAYLDYKWNSYMRYILLASVLYEVVLVLLLCLYLSFVKNTTEIPPLNVTSFCSFDEADSEGSGASNLIDSNWTKGLTIFCLLVIVIIADLLYEIRWFKKTKVSLKYLCSIRFYRALGVCILLWPAHFRLCDIVIKETWQWQVGIWTLLLSWFHMIQTLNSLPFLSVFMPVTIEFVKSFLRVIMYIVIILFVFAFVFHLLLHGKSAFETIPIAFIKTTVWVLGDLAYDDTFLSEESPITYPAMTNIIFLLLVTSISGFIVNMIIAQPTDHLDLFRERANYHKTASRIKLFCRIDAGFESIKKKYLVSHITVETKNISMTDEDIKDSRDSADYNKNDQQVADASSAQLQIDNALLISIIKKLDRIEVQLKNQRKK